MKAWGVTKDDLQTAAAEVGVRLYNIGQTGKSILFTLKTDPSATIDHGGGLRERKAPYRRMSRRSARIGPPRTVPGAVCWHGHRDFLRRVFELRPDARVKSMMADYQGREDFEQTYRDTREEGGERMGVEIRPFDQACYCLSEGSGQDR